MFERFTSQTRDVVKRAQQEAQTLRHPYVDTEHLLLALLAEPAGGAYTVLHTAGLDAPRVRTEIERRTGTPSKILDDDDAAALQTIGIDLDAVLAKLEESFGPDALEPASPAPRRGLLRGKPANGTRFSPRSRKVLGLSVREAIRLHHDHIGPEHVLLGLLRDGGSPATEILTGAGLDLDELRRATLTTLGGS